MQNGVSLDSNANGDMMSMSPQAANQNQIKANMVQRRMIPGMMNQMQAIPGGNRILPLQMQQNMLAAQNAMVQAQNTQLPSQSQQPSTPTSQVVVSGSTQVHMAQPGPTQANHSLKRNNEGVNQPLSSPTKRARMTPNETNYLQSVATQRSGTVNQQAQLPIAQQNNMVLTTVRPLANAISSPELKSNNRQPSLQNGKSKNAPTPQMQQMRQSQVQNINSKSISPHGNLQSLSVQSSHDIQDPQLMNQVNLQIKNPHDHNANIHNNPLHAIPMQNTMNQANLIRPNIPGATIMQNYGGMGMTGMVSYPNNILMQRTLMRPNDPNAQKFSQNILSMDQNSIDKYTKQTRTENNKVVKVRFVTQQQQPSGGSSITATTPQQMVVSNGQAQSQQTASTPSSGVMPSINSQQDMQGSLNMNIEELENFAAQLSLPIEDFNYDILATGAGTNDNSLDIGDILNLDLLEDIGPPNNTGPNAASNGN
ncbi:334_t:CDS:2 [Cetraspora pellucida]|uniref:334_t:CDS:1 n=1 Tax=Cetraspora pellucida TaxID=1433469 RepID=A0A9N9DGD3_9GLOM|nr:334_t:CDS:2 [Cetraspora pellucida]